MHLLLAFASSAGCWSNSKLISDRSSKVQTCQGKEHGKARCSATCRPLNRNPPVAALSSNSSLVSPRAPFQQLPRSFGVKMCQIFWHLKCLKTETLSWTATFGSIRTVLGRSTFHHLSIAHANNAMRMADGTCCPGAGMVLWRKTMAMMRILMVMTAMGIR